MPAARAFCASLQMESSTCEGAAIIWSASSSMMMTTWGIGRCGSPSFTLYFFFLTFSL
jgi:hypothetical protein